MGKTLAALCLLVPSTAAAGTNVDYVARAGDDSTAEHVTVVRSKYGSSPTTTYVSYEKGAILDEREDGFTVALTTGSGYVPNWTFLGLPRFALLTVDAAAIEVVVTTLDCDLEGFCDVVSSEPAEGLLQVRWTATDATTWSSGPSFSTPAHAVGVAFDGELDLPGDLSASVWQ
ncbi:MAG: hypothetical protein K8M05_39425 [Deltaproteobacteria bacterium]|nr:hypothetical protein [Kofleriaceae bacterium]